MKKRSIFSIALIVVLCLTVMLSLVACNKDKNKTEEKKVQHFHNTYTVLKDYI